MQLLQVEKHCALPYLGPFTDSIEETHVGEGAWKNMPKLCSISQCNHNSKYDLTIYVL